MKTLTLFLLFTIGLISCTNSEDNTNKLELAEKYYKALDNSDYAAMIDNCIN